MLRTLPIIVTLATALTPVPGQAQTVTVEDLDTNQTFLGLPLVQVTADDGAGVSHLCLPYTQLGEADFRQCIADFTTIEGQGEVYSTGTEPRLWAGVTYLAPVPLTVGVTGDALAAAEILEERAEVIAAEGLSAADRALLEQLPSLRQELEQLPAQVEEATEAAEAAASAAEAAKQSQTAATNATRAAEVAATDATNAAEEVKAAREQAAVSASEAQTAKSAAETIRGQVESLANAATNAAEQIESSIDQVDAAAGRASSAESAAADSATRAANAAEQAESTLASLRSQATDQTTTRPAWLSWPFLLGVGLLLLVILVWLLWLTWRKAPKAAVQNLSDQIEEKETALAELDKRVTTTEGTVEHLASRFNRHIEKIDQGEGRTLRPADMKKLAVGTKFDYHLRVDGHHVKFAAEISAETTAGDKLVTIAHSPTGTPLRVGTKNLHTSLAAAIDEHWNSSDVVQAAAQTDDHAA